MLFFCLFVVFVLGAAFGSFLNVCVYRLPHEKSLLWPESRCYLETQLELAHLRHAPG